MSGNIRSKSRSHGPAPLSDRGFGFLCTVIICMIGGIVWIIGGAYPTWAIWAPVLLAVLAFSVPGVLMPFNRIWQRFIVWFAGVNNVVLAALAFFVAITPTALIVRLIGHDPLARQIRGGADSYWSPVRRQTTAETLNDPF